MIDIRLMTIDDYDDIYDLWINTPGMGLNNLDDSKDGIARFLKRNPNTCFIAKSSNETVGVILAGNDGRRGYIYHTSVKIDYRKQGIGRALVNNALDALRAEGINKVGLFIFSRNELGNQFWESLGFTKRDDINYRNIALTDIKRIDT